MGLLRGVIDPELGSDIVELGMAKGAQVSEDGVVVLEIALTTSGCPLRAQIQKDIRSRLTNLPGVTRVKINWGELTQDERTEAMSKARFNVSQDAPDTAIPPTTKVVMIASGKGGVGKSSITTNLAAALAEKGYAVGVMDADIWGFSVPRMLGVEGDLLSVEGKIQPLVRKIGEGRVEVVSMGFLVAKEDSALMWRGLMLNRAVQHFCQDVGWSDDLDYLLIDMPPGTGDVQMGLAKMLPRAEMVIITTPALNAQKVAARVADMGRKNYLRIVGVIENMTEFVAPRRVPTRAIRCWWWAATRGRHRCSAPRQCSHRANRQRRRRYRRTRLSRRGSCRRRTAGDRYRDRRGVRTPDRDGRL